MVSKNITETALTTGLANSYFAGKVAADAFRGDVSMCAAARALFAKRIHDGENINIRVIQKFIRGTDDYSDITSTVIESGQLIIYNLCMTKDNSGKWIPGAVSAMKGNGLYRLEAIEKFFETQKTTALVYTDRPYDPKIPKSPLDNTKTMVIVENLTTMRFRLLAGMLPRFFGKWFQKTPRTEKETKAICLGVLANDPAEFLQAVADVATELDFRSGMIRRALGDFETKFAASRIKSLETRIRDNAKRIDSLSSQIGALLNSRDDLLATLDGYRNQDKMEPLTMRYFLQNKNLFLEGADDSSLTFSDQAWLNGWDPEKAKSTFANGHCSSWLEYNGNYGFRDEDAMLLYKAIFLDEIVKVRLWSRFRLNLRERSPLEVLGSEKNPDIVHALPNPHHFYNTCPGGNQSLINAAVIERDMIGAVEQCISATAGINLTEHASYCHFARDLFNPAFGEVIYIPSLDEWKTTKDAIEWLKEQASEKKRESKAKAEKEEGNNE